MTQKEATRATCQDLSRWQVDAFNGVPTDSPVSLRISSLHGYGRGCHGLSLATCRMRPGADQVLHNNVIGPTHHREYSAADDLKSRKGSKGTRRSAEYRLHK